MQADLTDPEPSLQAPIISVSVDKSRSYGRGVLQGLADYIETYGANWSIFLAPLSGQKLSQSWLHHWSGSGLIAYREDESQARTVSKRRLPMVDVAGHLPYELLDRLSSLHVGNDDVTIGRLAAEHLLECGLRHFAFSGYRDQLWADRRRSAFRQASHSANIAT